MYCYYPKPYTPLVHWNMRFFFSAPYRYRFSTDADERRFTVVKEILSELAPGEYDILKAIIAKPTGFRDLQDSYIHERMKERGMSDEDSARFYELLDRVDRKIAVNMGYIYNKN